MNSYLWTGQRACYDEKGRVIPCEGSGQDGEYRTGRPWPRPRFTMAGEGVVHDLLTGLSWTRRANFGGFPVSWQEALAQVAAMNSEKTLGHADWRLPNRRELRSLLDFETRKPALPAGHPFTDVFLNWYWTSTTAAIDTRYAWYVHLEGGRMFFGRKDQYYLFWPVRGASRGILPRTGQRECFGPGGERIDCPGTGQDGEMVAGGPWPRPRFRTAAGYVLDRLTGLQWCRQADPAGAVTWQQALARLEEMRKNAVEPGRPWRLPTINELESLVDCSAHSPALSIGHPFSGVRDVYWSSTTSFYEPDWAWALYLNKGATGVGFKKTARFHVWPVS